MKFRVLLSVCLLSLSTQMALAPLAVAQPESAPAVEVPAGGLNERQALDRVRAQFPGNVISINEVRQGERTRFRIRLDNEGNIYTVYVDKTTGVITRE